MMLKMKILVGLLFIVGIILLLIISFGETSGETIIVAQDGNGDYENIQDAIDNADEGDTIRVYGGIYEENVVVDETLSLMGNGSEETTIDGGEVEMW